MDHTDHVNLLRPGLLGPVGTTLSGGVWADFGSGAGAFTLALAELLGPAAEIYSIDRDPAALNRQEQIMRARFPAIQLHYWPADFTQALSLPPLTGAIMANALHFQRLKDPVVGRIFDYLQPGGRFIVIEYNTDHGNPWVPHPFTFATWQALARRNGFRETRLLATYPSRFLGEIYSAVSLKMPV